MRDYEDFSLQSRLCFDPEWCFVVIAVTHLSQTSRSDTTGLSQSLILSNLLPGIQRNKSQPKSSPCFKSPGVRIIRGLTRKRWTWYLFLSGAKQIENNIFQTNLSWLCIRVNHRNHFKFVYFIYSESLIRTCNFEIKAKSHLNILISRSDNNLDKRILTLLEKSRLWCCPN